MTDNYVIPLRMINNDVCKTGLSIKSALPKDGNRVRLDEIPEDWETLVELRNSPGQATVSLFKKKFGQFATRPEALSTVIASWSVFTSYTFTVLSLLPLPSNRKVGTLRHTTRNIQGDGRI